MKHQKVTEFCLFFNQVEEVIKTPKGHIISGIFPDHPNAPDVDEISTPTIFFKDRTLDPIPIPNWKTKGLQTGEEIDCLIKKSEPSPVRDCTPDNIF